LPKINLWTKLLPFTPFLERLVKKTEHLSVARQGAYDTLFTYFALCGLFHDEDQMRGIHNNCFWEFVNLNRDSETTRSDKEKETVPLTPFEEELHNILFSMKSSNKVVSNLEENEEEADDSNVDDDGSIEEDDGGNENAEEPIESEEELQAALNKLSKVKKYGISQMAILDLDVMGRALLGPDLKEN
jgi:hypothetical protein